MNEATEHPPESGSQSRALGIFRALRVAPADVTAACVAILGLLMAGSVGDEFSLSLLTAYVALAFMAIGLDLIWGYTGILSFGQAAWFGVAAYGFAIAIEHWNVGGLIPAILIGVSLATALSFLLGWFVFYSKVGVFFIAVITLALGVAFEQAVNQFSAFTGGLNGIILTSAFPWLQRETFFVVLAIFGLFLALTMRLVRSDFGLLLAAIRDDEERTRFLGFATPWVKTLVFGIAGLLSAIGGVLYTLQTGLASPTLVGFALSTQVVVWTAIGGRGTLIGPAVGAIAINYGQQQLSGLFLTTWQLALGAVLVLVVVLAPEGIYPKLVARIGRGNPRARTTSPLIETKLTTPTPTPLNAVLLSLSGVSQQFGGFQALTNVSLDIRGGELIGLIGPNGAGKSTLVDVVTSRRSPSAGHVALLGERADGHRPETLVRRGLVRTFQAGNVFNSVSVFGNLLLASRKGRLRVRDCLGRSRTLSVPAHVVQLLARSGLSGSLDSPAGLLAHGDRKWLEICMVLAQEPAVVLLDEPTAGLTEPERREIGTVLKDLVKQNKLSLVVIEHDLEFVRAISDRVVVLEQGLIALDGSTNVVANSPLVQSIYLGTP